MHSSRTTLQNRPKQQGAVFIVMLVFLIMGITAFMVSSLSAVGVQIKRDEITAKALAQAKEALIGYALTSDNSASLSARPGNFPCPDRNAPGDVGYGTATGSCSAAGGTSIGRLPWKTLGIPEQLDGDGEPLWYVLSDNFRKSAAQVNSDTPGSLLVYANDGSTSLTPAGSEAVAIIFAPGRITGNQQRNSAADKTSAPNYLETIGAINNAIAAGPFIAADKSDTFNDRLLIIKTRDFMPSIEKRVASELRNILVNYRAANGVYPYPAPFSSCKDNSTCDSNSIYCRGRLPYNAAPFSWTGSYSLPATAGGSTWFVDNQWYRVIYYSVGTTLLASAPAGCAATLNVSGNSTSGLFFMPGTPLGNVTRTYTNNNLAWYLEDAENQNMDDVYVSPTSSSNDQLYVLP